jgi:hypothetical protein
VSENTAAPTPLEKGRNDQVFVAVLIHVPPAFCASVSVAPLTVTPAPAVTVTTPAPRFTRTIFVPVAKAIDENGGIVAVVADALEKVTQPPASARTNVSEVKVTVRIVNALKAVFKFAAVKTAPLRNATIIIFLSQKPRISSSRTPNKASSRMKAASASDRVNVTSCESMEISCEI